MRPIVYKPFLLWILSGVMVLAGCSKTFLNVNSDPNRVTDQNITPELIFTQAANAVGVQQASGDFLFIDHWIGYIAQNGDFAAQQNENSYNIDFSFGNTLFLNEYHVLFDLHQAEVKALVTGDTAIAGASIILAAKMWQDLLDLFGNLPYSQSFQSATYPAPAYDKAQDIYNALQKRLDTAIIYLTPQGRTAFATADIVNQGDQGRWILFANALKLRLLIRQSEISGFNPAAEIAKIQAKGGVLMAGQSISVNPGYSNDVNKQNPFYFNNGWSPTGAIANPSNNANAYIIKLLKNYNDPRLGQFWYPVGFSGSSFVGCRFGAPVGSLPSGKNSSYFGPALVGTINTSSQGDGTGAKQNQWLVPSFESMFWYAEAVARGWITGDPKAAYEAAVTESFVWLNVPNASSAAASYLGSGPASWANAGGTPLSKAKFIAVQKYIALTAIDPEEAWSDIRRLDMLTDKSYLSAYPSAPPTLPVRLLYPQSEYTSNGANARAQGTINQFTSKLFWQP